MKAHPLHRCRSQIVSRCRRRSRYFQCPDQEVSFDDQCLLAGRNARTCVLAPCVHDSTNLHLPQQPSIVEMILAVCAGSAPTRLLVASFSVLLSVDCRNDARSSLYLETVASLCPEFRASAIAVELDRLSRR